MYKFIYLITHALFKRISKLNLQQTFKKMRFGHSKKDYIGDRHYFSSIRPTKGPQAALLSALVWLSLSTWNGTHSKKLLITIRFYTRMVMPQNHDSRKRKKFLKYLWKYLSPWLLSQIRIVVKIEIWINWRFWKRWRFR